MTLSQLHCCHQLAGSLAISVLIGLSSGFVVDLPQVAVPVKQSTPVKQNQFDRTVQTFRQSDRRWIEIDLARQRLIAWQGATPLYAVLVSTGKASTPTRSGVFAIQSRHRYSRMTGEDYDVANVPYTMYYSGSYAIHGAYWHHRFGTPVSHGCVNVAVNHARWLFNWASTGTPVVVHQ